MLAAPSPRAEIALRNQAANATRKAVSDANGQYVFSLIPPGRCDVEAGAARP